MFVTRKNFAAAVARAEAAEQLLNEREQRLRMIVSHASGGWTADWNRSINDVCVDISRNRNEVFAAGRLADMAKSERDVLDVMSDELITPIAQIAADTGVAENDVRTILRSFAIKGLAHFGHANNEGGEGTQLHGRGYTLTTTGLTLQQMSRNS